MLPISEISEGDQFYNANLGYPVYVVYVVEAIDNDEKLVKLQPVKGNTGIAFGSPFWESNKDRLFSEANRYDALRRARRIVE